MHHYTVSTPPVNVIATRSSSSALVEVSWSSPSNGSNIITGYRIFYGNQESIFLPSYVTRIELIFNDSQAETAVSIRSESMQRLPSDLVTTDVGKSHYNYCLTTAHYKHFLS